MKFAKKQYTCIGCKAVLRYFFLPLHIVSTLRVCLDKVIGNFREFRILGNFKTIQLNSLHLYFFLFG
jgi:hypothetical protein